MDLTQIAPGLARDAAGYWVAPGEAEISYPAGGHDFLRSFEDESFWFAHRSQVIAAALNRFPPEDGPLFDVGAGNGYVAALLQRAGFQTIAIEPSRNGAANAIARGVSAVVCGALPSPIFRHGTAGGIGLFDVLEHIEDDQGYLASLGPYLAPCGRLYLTVPAYPWLWSSNDTESGHKRRYTREGLIAVTTAAGYRVDYATYFFAPLPPAIYVARSLRSRITSRPRTASSARAQHRAGGKTMRHLAERFLAFEIRRVERGAAIPFGASCLLVASLTGSAARA